MNIETLQHESDTDLVFCPACDCPESILLGQLGNRTHLRCRGCGIDFSIRRENYDEDTFANPDHQFQD
jgi:hypothetical protein